MNPYVKFFMLPSPFKPMGQNRKADEQKSIDESFAIRRANGYRLRSQSRHRPDVKKAA